MKKHKKFLSVVLCAVIIVMSFFAEASYAVDSDVYYDFESGVLYVSGEGKMTVSYQNDSSIEEVYIERGVTSLPVAAFSGCVNLRKVTMSNSVVSIGIASFEDCTSLTELRLSDKITAIPELVFSNCTSLEKIKLPDSCELIDYTAFGNCSALKSVIIPYSMSSIDSTAFYKCNSLENIYYAGSEADWSNVNFTDNISADMTFLAPEFYYEKTFTSGRMALSLKLESGSFNSLDFQIASHGECSIYRVQVNKGFTSSYNRSSGMVSMCSDDGMAPDNEVVKVTYNVQNCENYSVDISFFNCSVRAEEYDIDVPVSGKSITVDGGHTSGEWTVTADPSADGDGLAEVYCECCGGAVRTLPYAFKNCTEENGIAFISSYEMNEDEFRAAYLTSDMPDVTASGQYIGTGSAVSVDYSDRIVYNYSVSLKGDVDGDGFCDAQDSMIIACICENMLFADDIGLCIASAADCNKDSAIDYFDTQFAELHGLQIPGA